MSITHRNLILKNKFFLYTLLTSCINNIKTQYNVPTNIIFNINSLKY